MEKTMYPKNRLSTHPGEILLEEFLIPMNISQVTLAKHLGIPIQRVNEIVKGKRGIPLRLHGSYLRPLEIHRVLDELTGHV